MGKSLSLLSTLLAGFSEVGRFDPFLLLDDIRSDKPDHYLKGFPWHPHRGIETITCVLDGDVEHDNCLGNKGGQLRGSTVDDGRQRDHSAGNAER